MYFVCSADSIDWLGTWSGFAIMYATPGPYWIAS